jgi:hypothetical protein
MEVDLGSVTMVVVGLVVGLRSGGGVKIGSEYQDVVSWMIRAKSMVT